MKSKKIRPPTIQGYKSMEIIPQRAKLWLMEGQTKDLLPMKIQKKQSGTGMKLRCVSN
jgi:hypothetical protein